MRAKEVNCMCIQQTFVSASIITLVYTFFRFITLQKNPSGTPIIQFYEKRSFRNLVHLFLPIEEAPINVVLSYINISLNNVQHQAQIYVAHNQKLQNEVEYRDSQIATLKGEINHLSSRLSEQEKIAFLKTNEVKPPLLTGLEKNLHYYVESTNIFSM